MSAGSGQVDPEPRGAQGASLSAPEPTPSSGRNAADLRAVTGLGLVALFVGEVGGLTLCPTAGLFGVPCPSCGLTRATVALLTGDLERALTLHPLVPLILPALAAILGGEWVAQRFLSRPGPRSLRLRRVASIAGLALVGVVVAVWLARFLGAFGGPVPVEPWFR